MYPTLFNVVVDNSIIICLAMTVEDHRVDHAGMVETVGRCLGFLYAYNGIVYSRNSDWIQHAMNVLVGLFRSYGLVANVAKSRTMTYQTYALQTVMSEEAVALKCTGLRDSYQVRLQRRIPCP